MFISDKFIFNGRHSDEMNISLVTFDSELFNDYGLNYNETITLGKTKSDYSYFTTESGDIEEITLNMALNDEHDGAMVWDDSTIVEVTNWLITDSFAEFISEDNLDLAYYFKVKKIIKKFTRDKTGYLEVAIQPFSNLAYQKYSKTMIFEKKGTFTINNPSNLKEPYKPILIIKNLGDNLNIITIHNESIDKELFEIRDLDKKEEITIDSRMGTVFNQYGEYKLMNCNREWLELKQGRNIINVSEQVEVTLKCQYPIRL